jgi:ABC-type Fe3+-siderophore transport system permease subunit
MQELEVTWRRVMGVWWLVAWRSVVGAVLIGAAIGFVIGSVGALAGIPEQSLTILGTAAGAIVGLVWAIVVVRMALRKQYSDFRLALVPR